MKKVWNKESYTPDKDFDGNTVEPRFYRTEDWGIEVDDDFDKPNFTTAKPHGLDQPVIPKQHFATKVWVLDEAIDQGTIDAMSKLSKLSIRRAMRALGNEDQLDAILASSTTFKNDWNDASEIDINDPQFVNALKSVQVDVDAIKRKIIELQFK